MHRFLIAAALVLQAPSATAEETATAVFAGGCFWCVESDFDKVPGVLLTVSGYTGGHLDAPTYGQVVAGNSGHREVVQITYDPLIVSYAELLEAFWRSVDPTDAGGQFCDRGFSYTTAIYAQSEAQREEAEQSKARAEAALGAPVVTPIEDAATFWPAEDYHQDYYKKNPARYQFYRWSCGRERTVRDVWGDEAYTGIPGVG